MMSPEFETLELLQGGDLPLSVIRGRFATRDAFTKGIRGLLLGGDVKLIHHGVEVPHHEWDALLRDGGKRDGRIISLTDQGAKRIG